MDSFMQIKYSEVLKNNIKYKRVLEYVAPLDFRDFEVQCLRMHDVINNHQQWLDIRERYLREYDPDTGLHTHPWHEFSCVFSGEIEYYTKEQRINVKDRSVFFMPPGIRHGWVPRTIDYWIFGIHLKFSPKNKTGEKIIREINKKLSENNYHLEATNKLRNILVELKSIDENSALKIHKMQSLTQSYLYESFELAFGDVLAKYDVEEIHEQKNLDIVKQVIQLIHENVSLPLQLEDIASHFEHTSRHLNRIFTAEEGISIGKYILKHKLSMACHSLKNSDSAVKTIAYEYGFNQTSYFCRLFKKTFGLSPKQYREMNRQKVE